MTFKWSTECIVKNVLDTPSLFWNEPLKEHLQHSKT